MRVTAQTIGWGLGTVLLLLAALKLGLLLGPPVPTLFPVWVLWLGASVELSLGFLLLSLQPSSKMGRATVVIMLGIAGLHFFSVLLAEPSRVACGCFGSLKVDAGERALVLGFLVALSALYLHCCRAVADRSAVAATR